MWLFRTFARSELLSTFFPTWIWHGRQWRKGKVPKYDPYYWINAHSHPVVSSYYPPHAISSMAASRLGVDAQFTAFVSLLIAHFIFLFVGYLFLLSTWATFLVSIFGAITLTFGAYNIKQQPCIVYTIAWFPWLLYGIAGGNVWLASVSLGMILLAGYYPLAIQIIPISVGAAFLWGLGPLFTLSWIMGGLAIGACQLWPFFKYLPKTIRANKHDEIGKVPWWHFFSLIFPKAFRFNVNGVGYWEMAYYVGIVPLVFLASSTSRAWLLAVVSSFLMMGLGARFFPRIPARWAFTFQFALTWCALSGLNNAHLSTNCLILLTILQLFDLWNHNRLLPTRPYSELYEKPSRSLKSPILAYLKAHLNDGSRVSGLPYPHFTGHIPEIRTLGYCGGMQLKLMAKWRQDENPNGSGLHDYFRGKEDGDELDIARVQFAYTRSKKLNWKRTEVPNLYLNPRYTAKP